MQRFVLNATRKNVNNGILNKDVFAIDQWFIYTQDEVLQVLSDSQVQKESLEDITDVCMIRASDCFIEIYTFYLFMQMEKGHNNFANEYLQDTALFEPYMPLFTTDIAADFF